MCLEMFLLSIPVYTAWYSFSVFLHIEINIIGKLQLPEKFRFNFKFLILCPFVLCNCPTFLLPIEGRTEEESYKCGSQKPAKALEKFI